MSNRNEKVLICAGGTGGGIYPALAAAHEMMQAGLPKENLLWIGVAGEMEERLIPREGIQLERIVGGGIAGLSRWQQLVNSLKLLWSIWLSNRIMARFHPNVVFLTGGYMAWPVGVAARLRGVPSVMYLPDLEPGSALKAISRSVSKITATFEASKAYFPEEKEVIEVGYPVRKALVEAAEIPKETALSHFDLSPERPVLFVFGGSRGAWSINKALISVLPDLLKFAQVIHISGTLTWKEVEENARRLTTQENRYYRPFPYLHEDMGMAFRAADLVVARAGASMMGESPLFGVPSVLVPYPHAWRYQKVNADYLADRGAAIRLNDEALEAKLLPLISDLLKDPQRLETMKTAARELYRKGAANRLAMEVINSSTL